jgi:hypothetical protein
VEYISDVLVFYFGEARYVLMQYEYYQCFYCKEDLWTAVEYLSSAVCCNTVSITTVEHDPPLRICLNLITGKRSKLHMKGNYRLRGGEHANVTSRSLYSHHVPSIRNLDHVRYGQAGDLTCGPSSGHYRT